MGLLHYNNRCFEFDDHLLAHLQVVTAVKLRRMECFFLTWQPGSNTGMGRQTIWLAAGIPLHFDYSPGPAPTIARPWIEQLIASANSGTALDLNDPRNKKPDSATSAQR